MTLITKVSPSMDTMTGQYAPQITGLYAGEALEIAAACYINADGLVYESNAEDTGSGSGVHGFTARAVVAGQPVTLFGRGARFRYAADLTPGAVLFLAETDGRLDDGTTTGDEVGTALCVDDTDIVVLR